jgi:CheY-like chemotaxis protein
MKHVHILLIEDNEGDILLTTEALQEARITNNMDVVKDGKEAIDRLTNSGIYIDATVPDLILLDVNLPKKNGHEVLKYIRENDALKHIPVIMLTTFLNDKERNPSSENHANGYIAKPVEAENFMKTIGTIETFAINIVKLPEK